MRRLRILVLVAAAALLLGGCFRYQSAVVVADDGSGVAQEVLLVDRDALLALFDDDAAVDAHIPRAAALDLPAWLTARDHTEGRFQGIVIDLTFDTPEQLGQRLGAVHEQLARATGSRATSTVEVQRLEDGWQFSMRTTDLATAPDLPGPGSPELGGLYRSGRLVVAVQLPGRIVDHNADQVANGQLVWHLSAQTVQTQFYARTTTSGVLAARPGSSGPLQLATAAATVGGLVTFAAVAWSRRRRPDAAAAPAAAHLGDRPHPDPGPPAGWPLTPPSGPPATPLGPGATPPPPPAPPRPSAGPDRPR